MASTYINLAKDPAIEIAYDPTASTLVSENVQAALDELAAGLAAGVSPFAKVVNFAALPVPASVPIGTTRYVQNESGSYITFNKKKRGWYESDGVSWKYAGDNTRLATDCYYDNSVSGLIGITVQVALDSMKSLHDAHLLNFLNPHAVTAAQVGADPVGTAAAAIVAHVALADPHVQYLQSGDNVSVLVNDAGYLNETAHDALPADNPHAVTFTQASTADPGTDITAAEAETLTDGSNADLLHIHAFAHTIVSSTTPITSSSTSDILLTSMTITPSAGKYLILFSGYARMSVDKQWIDTIIYVAGSGIAATRLHIRREKALDETPFAMHHVAIVNGTQAIEVQWKVTTGTGTFYNRQLSIVKIG